MKSLLIKVKPNARLNQFNTAGAGGGGDWTAQLKSRPVDGKANQELIALVGRHFGCPKSAVRIKAGARGRSKRVQAQGID